MDPVKIAGVAEWPTPSNKKEVQSFLGFTNFYRRFIQDSQTSLAQCSPYTKNAARRWGSGEISI